MAEQLKVKQTVAWTKEGDPNWTGIVISVVPQEGLVGVKWTEKNGKALKKPLFQFNAMEHVSPAAEAAQEPEVPQE